MLSEFEVADNLEMIRQMGFGVRVDTDGFGIEVDEVELLKLNKDGEGFSLGSGFLSWKEVPGYQIPEAWRKFPDEVQGHLKFLDQQDVRIGFSEDVLEGKKCFWLVSDGLKDFEPILGTELTYPRLVLVFDGEFKPWRWGIIDEEK